MAHDRLDSVLAGEVEQLRSAGTSKGAEKVVTEVIAPHGGQGRRYRLEGSGHQFIRMNSNGYLGLAHHPAVIEAEERATAQYGAGPGAVRFISGTTRAHVELEQRLAGFHARAEAVVLSSAYAAVVSTLMSLATAGTAVLSDELNHNCIINGLRMARPSSRDVYPHLAYDVLDSKLSALVGVVDRVLVVTDGVFSMRGDFADLGVLAEIVARHDDSFPENAVLIVDDSHGVGAFGQGGRGTEGSPGAAPTSSSAHWERPSGSTGAT
jgi:glycine C-acetyltransferase